MLVCVAWVFFRADSLDTVGEMAQRVLYGGGSTVLTPALVAAIAGGLALQFVPEPPVVQARLLFARIGAVPQGIVLASVLVITGALVGSQGVPPFIYYQF